LTYIAPDGRDSVQPIPDAVHAAKEVGLNRRNQTKTGILFLAVAAFFWWIPGVYLYAAIAAVPAFVLIYRDRTRHGGAHARNVRLAALLAVLGYVCGAISSVILGVALSALLMIASPTDPRLFWITFAGFTSSVVVVAAVSGLAPVLITRSLQPRLGRILLWLAYAINGMVQGLVLVLEVQAIPGYLSQLIGSGGAVNSPSSFANFFERFTYLQWFGAIPAALDAAAYLLLFRRLTLASPGSAEIAGG
jgi:hypothetical protein